MSSSSAAGSLKRRRFSGAKIQPTRVKKVMQSDEEIGRMVASVPVAIGRAMEHFTEKFLQAAAAEVANTGSRTLSPVHMKLAMLVNPHFAFLEPILRDIGVPARAGEAYAVCVPAALAGPSSSSAGEMVQMPLLSPIDASIDGVLSHLPVPPGLPPTNHDDQEHPAPILQNSRRSSSIDGEKRPRGRPRKIKKDKCVEDDPTLDNVVNGSLLPSITLPPPAPPSETNDADRLLMPPPAFLPMKPM